MSAQSALWRARRVQLVVYNLFGSNEAAVAMKLEMVLLGIAKMFSTDLGPNAGHCVGCAEGPGRCLITGNFFHRIGRVDNC